MQNRLKSRADAEKFTGYDQGFEVDVIAFVAAAWCLVAISLFFVPVLLQSIGAFVGWLSSVYDLPQLFVARAQTPAPAGHNIAFGLLGVVTSLACVGTFLTCAWLWHNKRHKAKLLHHTALSALMAAAVQFTGSQLIYMFL